MTLSQSFTQLSILTTSVCNTKGVRSNAGVKNISEMQALTAWANVDCKRNEMQHNLGAEDFIMSSPNSENHHVLKLNN